ncbi:MAG TPA: hypothetical protein VK171_06320, partial [Fimbriimonas sp.]|nr:hypothetical protein [Fimbriimonas sp.]
MGTLSSEDRIIHRRVTSSMVEVVLVEMEPGYTHYRERCPDGQFWLSVEGTQFISSARGFRKQNALELHYYCPKEPAVRTAAIKTLAYGIRLRLSGMNEQERDDSWIQGRKLDWQITRRMLQVLNAASHKHVDPHRLDELIATAISTQDSTIRESSRAKWLGKVEELLRNNPNMQLSELAVIVGLAPAYLSSEFAKQKGIPLSHLRRQIALE